MSTGESASSAVHSNVTASDPYQYYYQYYGGNEGYYYSDANSSGADYYTNAQYGYDTSYCANYYQPAATTSGTVANLAALQKDAVSVAEQASVYIPTDVGSKRQVVVSTSGYAGPQSNTNTSSREEETKKKKKKPIIRSAAGETWEDSTLQNWDEFDFRLFAGDLGNEVTDELLYKAFSKYPSLLRTRVVRDKRTGKTKGYGFISFKDPNEFMRAWREMNGKYVGNRPIKLRKSTWKDRNLDVKIRKEREQLGLTSKIR